MMLVTFGNFDFTSIVYYSQSLITKPVTGPAPLCPTTFAGSLPFRSAASLTTYGHTRGPLAEQQHVLFDTFRTTCFDDSHPHPTTI